MRYLFKGDKNNPFMELANKFKPRKTARLKGNNFLVTLDPDQAQYYRKAADAEKMSANQYVSKILNKLGR